MRSLISDNIEYPILPARDPSGRTRNDEVIGSFEIRHWIFTVQYSKKFSYLKLDTRQTTDGTPTLPLRAYQTKATFQRPNNERS